MFWGHSTAAKAGGANWTVTQGFPVMLCTLRYCIHSCAHARDMVVGDVQCDGILVPSVVQPGKGASMTRTALAAHEAAW